MINLVTHRNFLNCAVPRPASLNSAVIARQLGCIGRQLRPAVGILVPFRPIGRHVGADGKRVAGPYLTTF